MGAFEMAFAGFQKLCSVLWTSTFAVLRFKTKEFVQELLDSFWLQDLDFQVMRSAGEPYFLLVKKC